MESGLMTTAEVADLLGVHKCTVWRLRIRKNNPLPFINIGNNAYFKRTAIEPWIRERNQERENKKQRRRCYTCKTVKPISEFVRDNSKFGCHGYECKDCRRVYFREYSNRPEVKHRLKQQRNKRYDNIKTTPKVRIEGYMHLAFRCAAKGKGEKSFKKLLPILGYDAQQLRDYLEAQFKPGMTFDNHGNKGWHIDHIKPRSSFNYTSMEDEEFKACWALENLQPLWAGENLQKGNLAEQQGRMGVSR